MVIMIQWEFGLKNMDLQNKLPPTPHIVEEPMPLITFGRIILTPSGRS